MKKNYDFSKAVKNPYAKQLKRQFIIRRDRDTVDERLDLISGVWDSIPDSLEELPIPEWHGKELERRLAAADADPDGAIPWEEVRQRLQKKGWADGLF